jgi:Icc-related predicted phosphoesterase
MLHQKANNLLNLTFISDTHGEEPKLPGGDILFHTGDLSVNGYRSEIIKQLNYLNEQLTKYKHVVLIPGNHDFWAERHSGDFRKACKSGNLALLMDEGITILGLKIWGSPAVPFYHDWAFNNKPDSIKKIWEKIPEKTDILITHGPPYGILDMNILGIKSGCPLLFDTVKYIKPKIHAFGHIHEGAGAGENNDTLFLNSAMNVIQVKYSDQEISYILNPK